MHAAPGGRAHHKRALAALSPSEVALLAEDATRSPPAADSSLLHGVVAAMGGSLRAPHPQPVPFSAVAEQRNTDSAARTTASRTTATSGSSTTLTDGGGIDGGGFYASQRRHTQCPPPSTPLRGLVLPSDSATAPAGRSVTLVLPEAVNGPVDVDAAPSRVRRKLRDAEVSFARGAGGAAGATAATLGERPPLTPRSPPLQPRFNGSSVFAHSTAAAVHHTSAGPSLTRFSPPGSSYAASEAAAVMGTSTHAALSGIMTTTGSRGSATGVSAAGMWTASGSDALTATTAAASVMHSHQPLAGSSVSAHDHAFLGATDSSVFSSGGGGGAESRASGFSLDERRPLSSCHIPLNLAVIINVFVTVVLVAVLSLFPLNTVSLRSMDHVTTTLSSFLANTLAESINSNLYYLPLTVRNFASAWQHGATVATWNWSRTDMPHAMEQICEMVSVAESTSHLLYLTLSSPYSGFSAYCSPQYSATRLVGQYTMENTSSYRYYIDPVTLRYAEPPEPFYAVQRMSAWDFTVTFGGAANPWHTIAVPWYNRYLGHGSSSSLDADDGAGWTIFTQNRTSIVTYSIPFLDYMGNPAIITGALQPAGIVAVFPDGLLPSEVGRAMVLDPTTGMILLTSWREDTAVVLDHWNTSNAMGEAFSERAGVYVEDITDPLMRLALQELGGLEGLANKPLEVSRWQKKFSDGSSDALVLANRIHVKNGNLNLIVLYAIKRSEYTANIGTVRKAVIISVVLIIVIIALVDLVMVYLFLQPLRAVAAGLHDAAQLKDGSMSADGRVSVIREVAAMQYHFSIMNAQLMRMKAFLPQGVLHSMSTYSESDGAAGSDLDDSIRDQPTDEGARGGVHRSRYDDGDDDRLHRAGSPRAGKGAALGGNGDSSDDDEARRRHLMGEGDDDGNDDGRDESGGAVRASLPSAQWRRHATGMRLDERALLDDVNRFRRRYCTVAVFFLHVRESDTGVTLIDALTAAFMRSVIPSVLSHGGVIEVQRPDTILVSFGAHSRVAMHQNRAARCALEAMRVANTSTSVGARIGCMLDVGEYYVGTCGAAQRYARVAFGGRSPPATPDLIKLSKSLDCQVLVSQRLAAALDDSLVTIPVDSVLYTLSSKCMILYELRGSLKTLPAGLRDEDVREMMRHVRGAFHRMLHGDYGRAVGLLLPFAQLDRQAARLASACRMLADKGFRKPFVRNVGRIKLSDADVLYTDREDPQRGSGVKADTVALSAVEGGRSVTSTVGTSLTGRSDRNHWTCSPQSMGLDTQLLLLQNGTTRVIEAAALPDACEAARDRRPNSASGAADDGDPSSHHLHDYSSAAVSAPDDGDDTALFEMFVDVEDADDAAPAPHPAGHSSVKDSSRGEDSRQRNGASTGGAAPSAAADGDIGELPMTFTDCEGGQWSRSADRLGRGAFSVVYRGLSQAGDLVALKCFQLRARNVDVNAIVEEVRLFSGLHHENIVQYVSVYASDLYVIEVMEFVPGGSLDTLLTNFGCLSKSAMRRFLRDILRGLSYLHSVGIVHCDIKPHNVLLAMDGQCKLSDFGSALAKATSSVCQLEDVLEMRGTAGYMAPEVARGDVPTAKSDVFSLGVAVLELLTGVLPWNYAETVQTHNPPPTQRPFSSSLPLPPGGNTSGSATQPRTISTVSSTLAADSSSGGPAANSSSTASLAHRVQQHIDTSSVAAVAAGSTTASANVGLVRGPARGGSARRPIEQVVRSATQLIVHIGKGLVVPVIPPNLDGDVKEFLDACLHADPQQRATAEELLGHPWLL